MIGNSNMDVPCQSDFHSHMTPRSINDILAISLEASRDDPIEIV